MTDSKNKFRLPRPIISFSSSSIAITELVRGSGYDSSSYPWASRMLGRFPLPDWQRGLVWSKKKNLAFIDSVFQGFDLGSVMINDWEESSTGILRPMSDILIDGQQRTNALIQYTSNEFPYEGYYWRELNRNEQRVFLESQLGLKKTRCFDEAILKRVYNLLNFSGVKHTAKEMAK
ncbi:DUF262 domain-containing protein [Vibrio sp. Y2-5]|uniref:DUF262 domain-containing protein n=1 Tax=Vibrio sp. Y2-5 TaxID=2743977 RepID=UPI001660BF9C|nr:DUF262 domain-containing protein [Vibrio sp. Y2-5]MBD0788201.1 DUF262 domain-containing protein [Vibrio sp. Y2-5]